MNTPQLIAVNKRHSPPILCELDADTVRELQFIGVDNIRVRDCDDYLLLELTPMGKFKVIYRLVREMLIFLAVLIAAFVGCAAFGVILLPLIFLFMRKKP